MFRFETLVVALLLGSPVAALWLRGDFTDADVWWRFALAWLAAWAAVSLVSAAARPLAGTAPESDDADDTDDYTGAGNSAHDEGRSEAADTTAAPGSSPS